MVGSVTYLNRQYTIETKQGKRLVRNRDGLLTNGRS